MLKSKIFTGFLTCIFSHSLFAAQDDVVYIDLGTPHAAEHVDYENTQSEEVVEQKKSVKCSKTFMFITAAGLASAAVGTYILSTCKDIPLDINNPDTFNAQNCDDSLGAQLKNIGLVSAGVGAAMTALNWCGKKAGCHQSNSRTTNHDLNRAGIMISRM